MQQACSDPAGKCCPARYTPQAGFVHATKQLSDITYLQAQNSVRLRRPAECHLHTQASALEAVPEKQLQT